MICGSQQGPGAIPPGHGSLEATARVQCPVTLGTPVFASTGVVSRLWSGAKGGITILWHADAVEANDLCAARPGCCGLMTSRPHLSEWKQIRDTHIYKYRSMGGWVRRLAPGPPRPQGNVVNIRNGYKAHFPRVGR